MKIFNRIFLASSCSKSKNKKRKGFSVGSQLSFEPKHDRKIPSISGDMRV